MQGKELKLCPNCPLTEAWKQEALKRLRKKQYTRKTAEPTALKICMERRKILRELGLTCPHYPEMETITYHTNPVVKAEIDRKTNLKKRQHLTHFL